MARVDLPVVLTVTNGSTGIPVEGANVDGQTSGKDGEVSVVFRKTGIRSVKAEKAYWIRSRGLEIDVVPWVSTVSTRVMGNEQEVMRFELD